MRYLAWIAIISLQMGMFVCGAGVDVCHAADVPTQSQQQHMPSDSDESATSDSVCMAHASHVFLWLDEYEPEALPSAIHQVSSLNSLYLSEIIRRIEQPPKA